MRYKQYKVLLRVNSVFRVIRDIMVIIVPQAVQAAEWARLWLLSLFLLSSFLFPNFNLIIFIFARLTNFLSIQSVLYSCHVVLPQAFFATESVIGCK